MKKLLLITIAIILLSSCDKSLSPYYGKLIFFSGTTDYISPEFKLPKGRIDITFYTDKSLNIKEGTFRLVKKYSNNNIIDEHIEYTPNKYRYYNTEVEEGEYYLDISYEGVWGITLEYNNNIIFY